MEELVSVIVPIYNVENFLDRCIDSIEYQTYRNIEVILVNDGSTDKSGEMCNSYEKKYKNIRVIHKKNEGVSKARNIGLKNANGKYILFVDGDDTLQLDMIQKLITIMKEKKAQIVQCCYKTIYEDGNYMQKSNNEKVYTYSSKDEILKKFFDKKITISVWNKIFEKSLIDNIYFNENVSHYEDKLFVYYALLNCKKLVHTNYLGYNYFKRKNSASYSTFKYSYLEIREVDEMILNNVKLNNFNKKIFDLAEKNVVETDLELAKMMIKSKANEKYLKEYNLIIREIKRTPMIVFLKLKIKKKFEVLLFKFKFFQALYKKALCIKNRL